MRHSKLLEALSDRTGLSLTICRMFLGALQEHIAVELHNNHKVQLQNIGTIKLERKGRDYLKFVGAENLYKKLHYQLDALHPFLKEVRKMSQEEQDALVQESIERPRRLRESLLTYLRHQLPHQLDWKNPHTHEKFTAQQITDYIFLYNQAKPEDATYMWLIWSSFCVSKQTLKKLEISEEKLKEKWSEILDSLLFMMMFQELEPAELRVFLDD